VHPVVEGAVVAACSENSFGTAARGRAPCTGTALILEAPSIDSIASFWFQRLLAAQDAVEVP